VGLARRHTQVTSSHPGVCLTWSATSCAFLSTLVYRKQSLLGMWHFLKRQKPPDVSPITSRCKARLGHTAGIRGCTPAAGCFHGRRRHHYSGNFLTAQVRTLGLSMDAVYSRSRALRTNGDPSDGALPLGVSALLRQADPGSCSRTQSRHPTHTERNHTKRCFSATRKFPN